MKAAVYYNNNDVRLQEFPVPELEPGDILLRVKASGICGSDLMEWYRVPKAPLVLGHEVAGEVVEISEGVKKLKVGDRVVATHHVPCNSCSYCLTDRHTLCPMIKETSFYPGGFSEYLRVPAVNVDRGVFVIPDGISYEEATFVEPLGCVIRAQRISGMGSGKSVAIIGSGVTGLLNLQYAISQGAGFTCAIDVNDLKLQVADSLGASSVYRSDDDVKELIKRDNQGRLIDLVIVCTGVRSAVLQSFDIVEKGGTILFFAPSTPDEKLEINFNELWWSGVSIKSSYAASPQDLYLALTLIAEGRVKVGQMITHRFSLSEIQKGFNIAQCSEDNLKIIIIP